MSKYATLEAQFNDQECLVKALADMGYKDVEIHDEAVNLVGYHGDTRAEKANVIVRRKYVGSAANDIGFVKTSDGKFAPIISEFDSGKHNTKWLNGLKSSFAEHRAAKEARRIGARFKSRAVVNGKLVIKYLDQRA
jgi:hypothetical protein